MSHQSQKWMSLSHGKCDFTAATFAIFMQLRVSVFALQVNLEQFSVFSPFVRVSAFRWEHNELECS